MANADLDATMVAGETETTPVSALTARDAAWSHFDRGRENATVLDAAAAAARIKESEDGARGLGTMMMIDRPPTIGTRGGGFGRRLRSLFGMRPPSPLSSTETSPSSDTSSDQRGRHCGRRGRHVPGSGRTLRHPRDEIAPGIQVYPRNDGREHHKRQRSRRSRGGSNSNSGGSGHEHRRRPSERRSRRRVSSSPVRSQSTARHPRLVARDEERIDRRSNNDRAGSRHRQRRSAEGQTRRHRRVTDHRANYHSTRGPELTRTGLERGRRTRDSAVAVQDGLDGRLRAGDQLGEFVYTPARQHRGVSPAAPLPVPALAQETGTPNYDDMSEDELFGVFLAEERAMDPLLKDLDARRAQGEDV